MVCVCARVRESYHTQKVRLIARSLVPAGKETEDGQKEEARERERERERERPIATGLVPVGGETKDGHRVTAAQRAHHLRSTQVITAFYSILFCCIYDFSHS